MKNTTVKVVVKRARKEANKTQHLGNRSHAIMAGQSDVESQYPGLRQNPLVVNFILEQ